MQKNSGFGKSGMVSVGVHAKSSSLCGAFGNVLQGSVVNLSK